MLNENINPNAYHYRRPSPPHPKLATLLVVVISFQEKIEMLKTKLCGFSSFSPAMYYLLLDRAEKSYIEMEDMLGFVKKSKPNFNIDSRYLKVMFRKFNQDDGIPSNRLSYFGFLNMIKPQFDSRAANDLLSRDSVVAGNEYNQAVKRTLEELICTTYACTAEHERVKQLIILGDMDEGGVEEGELYNTSEIMEIITQGMEDRSSRMGKATLDTFYEFINKHSEYEIQREDMKYLLAYLMCHEYQLNGEKCLNMLFMPIALVLHLPQIPVKDVRCGTSRQNWKPSENTTFKDGRRTNFLDFVHPNSKTKVAEQSRAPPPPDMRLSRQPPAEEIRVLSPPRFERSRLADPVYNPEATRTPFLERFLRESKVLKNMSRYQREQIRDDQSDSTAFVVEERHWKKPLVGQEHTQRPINRDFNLEEVLKSNSNLQKSEYQPKHRVAPMSRIYEREEQEQGGFLHRFMLQ